MITRPFGAILVRQKLVKICLGLIVCSAASVWFIAKSGKAAVEMMAGFFFLISLWEGPVVIPIADVFSPDRRWIAHVRYEDYPSMFSSPIYTVDLEPAGWAGSWHNKRIVEVEDEEKGAPDVAWKSAAEMHVTLHAPAENIIIKKDFYKGIVITY